MNQKHLLRFIKKKMRTCPDDVVIDSKGVRLTLTQVSTFLNIFIGHNTSVVYDATLPVLNIGISRLESESL